MPRRRRLSAAAHRVRAVVVPGVAADQLPACRRRRPVQDARQVPGRAPAVGAGRRGGRRSRRRCAVSTRSPRRDDDPARPVGEHAAHHAGRVRRRRRRRRHGAGAAVRRGDPGRLARHSQAVSRAASPATPSCCCSRSHTSAGCSTPPPGPGSSRTSPSSSPRRPGSTSSRSRPHGGFADARDFVAARSPRWPRPRAPTTSPTAGPRSPVSTSSRTSTRSPLPHARFVGWPTIARYAAAFEALRDRSDAYLARRRLTAAGAAAAARPGGRAQRPHHVRLEPAGLRRHRGGQPGNRRRRRVWRTSCREARTSTVAVLCGTDKRYGTKRRACGAALRARRHRARATGRAREGRCRAEDPTVPTNS